MGLSFLNPDSSLSIDLNRMVIKDLDCCIFMSGDADSPPSYKEAKNLANQFGNLLEPLPDLKKIMKEEAKFEVERKIKPIELLEELNEQTKELIDQT